MALPLTRQGASLLAGPGPPRGKDPQRAVRRGPWPSLAAGTSLAGRFEIERFLGAGAVGEVYEAFDAEVGERVAVKVMRPEIAADRDELDRFRREIQLARRVTHPNVCRVFELFHDPGGTAGEELWFLTMERVEGEALDAVLARRGRLPADEALPFAAQMIAGLAAAHAAGVIHRDFKTGNVLVAGEGPAARLVVTDFGLARRSEAGEASLRLTSPGALVGSPAYMAPEQVRGEEVSPAVDVYALGVVLYELVTGELPFRGDSAFSAAVKRLTEPPPSPRSRVPDLDPRWERAILRCLEVDPERRFEHVEEVLEALGGAPAAERRTRPGSVRPGSVRPGSVRQSSVRPVGVHKGRARVRGLWLWAGAALSLAAGTALLVSMGMGGATGRPEARADRLLAAGDFEGARLAAAGTASAAAARGDRPALAVARRLEGEALLGLARVDEALAAIRESKQLAVLGADLGGVAEATRLQALARKEQGDAAQAERDLEEALGFFRRQGDARGEGRALADLARLEREAKRNEEAERLYGQALVLSTSAGDRAGEARVHASLAGIRETAGDGAGSLAEREAALALFRELGDERSAARQLHGMGRVLAGSEDTALAGRRFTEALAIFHRLGERGEAAKSERALGTIAQQQGDLAAAIAFFDRALDDYRAAKEPAGVGLVLNDLALIARRQGSLWRAESLFREAAEVYREADSSAGQAAAWANLGTVLWRLGRLPEARSSLERSLELHRAGRDPLGKAHVQLFVARLELDSGRLGPARESAEQALQAPPEARDDALLVLAEVAAVAGDPAAARARLEEALALRREAGEPLNAATVELTLARLSVAEGKTEEAEARARAAAPLVERQQSLEDEALAAEVLARVALARGAPDEAAGLLAAIAPRILESEDLRLRLAHQLYAARVAAALDPAAGRARLEALIAEAERAGFVRLALDGRGLLAEI